MIKRPEKPFVPAERDETIRQEIISLLRDQTLSAKDISGYVRISEKEVYDHLLHIMRGAGTRGYSLAMDPPECRRCGFVFRKRDKLKKPGRCPICRSESIREPLFSINNPSR